MTAILLSVSMVLAADLSVNSPSALSMEDLTVSYSITNNANVSRTVTIPVINPISDNDGHNLTLTQSPSGAVVMANGTSITVTITNTTAVHDDFALGDFSTEFLLTDDNGDNYTQTVSFRNSFCEFGNIENSSRSLEIVRVRDKSSEDDWEWRPLDSVEVEVKVEFNADDDDDDIDAVIEVGLYDVEDNEFVDLEDEDDLERDISLDEGDSATEVFTIEVPSDVSDDSDRYRLYVKVYEEDDEDQLCADADDGDYYQDIKIEKESYDVILKDIEVTDSVPCGQEVQVSAKVYNVGEHDEDKVYVTLKNNLLGLNMDSETFSLDEGDDFHRVYFNFIVPTNISENTYKLQLYTHFKYKDSSDLFIKQSDYFEKDLKVEGACLGSEEKDASITAELSEDTPKAVAGRELVVKATVENTGTVKTAYTMSVTGNSLWSEVTAVDPETFTLEAGESKEVTIYFDVDSDAKGEKEFTIKADYGTGVESQKVLVTVEEGISAGPFMNHLRDNWFIYTIVLVNLILIIIIIVVARRIARRPVA